MKVAYLKKTKGPFVLVESQFVHVVACCVFVKFYVDVLLSSAAYHEDHALFL